MALRNWMLLEHELENLARTYGWTMDVSAEGDKIAVNSKSGKAAINITQLAHDLTDRGVMIEKKIVKVQE